MTSVFFHFSLQIIHRQHYCQTKLTLVHVLCKSMVSKCNSSAYIRSYLLAIPWARGVRPTGFFTAGMHTWQCSIDNVMLTGVEFSEIEAESDANCHSRCLIIPSKTAGRDWLGQQPTLAQRCNFSLKGGAMPSSGKIYLALTTNREEICPVMKWLLAGERISRRNQEERLAWQTESDV